MKRIPVFFLLGILILTVFPGNVLAQVNTLHQFAGFPTDGAHPDASYLVNDGSVFYGMTPNGGSNDFGVIFKINPDGSGYELLHEFAGGADGVFPYGFPIIVGSALYGITCYGGANSVGVIFKINTDGTGYTILHEFADGATDGATPTGSLVSDGSALYGMTASGGGSHLGVIFKINPDGTGYTLLHEFGGTTTDGSTPYGTPIVVGSMLYGMTPFGGAGDSGVIFRLNTDGTGYELLHDFTGGADDGGYPKGDVTAVNSMLYGMAEHGGDSGSGVIFRINYNGSGFALLHEFTSGTDDGGYPQGSLTSDGSALYGSSRYGGETDEGALFKIDPDGSGFELLHSFTSSAEEGYIPDGTPAIYDSTLYGMTSYGAADNNGAIFSLELAQAPIAQPIPTLGEWGAIILTVLLAMAAVVAMKRRVSKPVRTI